MRTLALALWLLVVASARPAAATCDPAAVCADVLASFWGQIEQDGLHLGWATDEESGISYYRLSKHNGTPGSEAFVGAASAAGECNSNAPYSLTVPYSSGYTYRIQVFAIGESTESCHVDVNP